MIISKNINDFRNYIEKPYDDLTTYSLLLNTLDEIFLNAQIMNYFLEDLEKLRLLNITHTHIFKNQEIENTLKYRYIFMTFNYSNKLVSLKSIFQMKVTKPLSVEENTYQSSYTLAR